MDILAPAGRRVVLLGNEAIARGAIEAGIGFSSAYPGTPSSEVGMTLARIAKKIGIYFEWSTNEKVAFEAAAGAAYSGVRSLVSMKHFGLNVASDSIMPVVYTGVNAGMVLMAADDPNGWSSAQSEQDSRNFAVLAKLPMLEPSNPQECLDFTKIAFEISEKFKIPVFLRTTTKVSHSIGTLRVGRIKKGKKRGRFRKNYEQFYNIRPNLQKMHRKVLEKLGEIEKKYGKLNGAFGNGRTGILSNGAAFEIVREIVGLERNDVKVGKISLGHPLSEKFVSDFISDLERVIIVEELDPYIEKFVRIVAEKMGYDLEIHGKDVFPEWGDFAPEIVYQNLRKFVKLPKPPVSFERHSKEIGKIKIPTRKAVMCPGCPHRSTFYAVKKVLGKGAKIVYAGDIGCYILGIFEPYQMQDFVISMGASAGVTHGIKKVSDQKAVVFMGDSTFFHAGMPGIANIVYNKGYKGTAPLIIVMDNGITAMTGHQPHPGTGYNAVGDKIRSIRIEDVLRGFGIKEIKVVNSWDQKNLQEAVSQLSKSKEPVAIVSRGLCRLLMRRMLRRQGKSFTKFEIDQEKCKKCGICTQEFACPAIWREKKNGKWVYFINKDMCWGCGVCAQICPAKAIHPAKK